MLPARRHDARATERVGGVAHVENVDCSRGYKILTLIEPPVTLREIKESGLFPEWALVRQSRLSTMTVPDEFVVWIKKERPSAGI